MRKFGVAVPGGADYVGLRYFLVRNTGNGLVLTDSSSSKLNLKDVGTYGGD